MSERTPAEILRAARERISDPTHHARYQFAVERDGRACEPGSEKASAWCAAGSVLCEIGATTDVLDDEGVTCHPAFFLLVEAADQMGGTISQVNDKARGNGGALTLYDRAIELAEAKG